MICRRWFYVGLCVAALCPSVSAENDSAVPKDFFESLTIVDKTILDNWASEIQDSRNVLIFPGAIAQELLLEYTLRLPDESPQKSNLSEFISYDPPFLTVQDPSQLRPTAFDEFAIRTFYDNTLPEMNATIDDPLYFSYMTFKHWSRQHPESVAAETETPDGPLVTVAALRMKSIESENFTWIDQIDFFVSESHTTAAYALRNVGSYDYAEFSYPKLYDCKAGALRIRVNDELSMIFVTQLNVSDAQCNSSENLLKTFKDVNLETINFQPQRMFVSIPILQVATIVTPAPKLIQMGVLTAEPYAFQAVPTFDRYYESAALIFRPEVPKDAPIVMISRDTPMFQADRPFLVAVLQKGNPEPVLLGLIQDPTVDI